MEKSHPRQTQIPAARNKMMDYLSHREHSEAELREKLARHFSSEEIEAAIQFGKEQAWIPDSAESAQMLAEKTAETLRRKGKGQVYIQQYLEKLMLPRIHIDPSDELEKAFALVRNKFSNLQSMDPSEKVKAARFLAGRGFDEEVIRKVIYE